MTSQPSIYKNKEHEAHSCLEPESVKQNTQYTLTISPADRHQFYETKRDRIAKFREQWYGRLLINLAPYATYELHVEVSKAGRLHCHGYITIKDILGFYVYAIPFMRDNTTFEIDTIKDRKVWDEYCTKQKHLFDSGHNPMIQSLKDQSLLVVKSNRSKLTVEEVKNTFDMYQDDD